MAKPKAQSPTGVRERLGREVRRLRVAKGWTSQARLATEVQNLGVDLDQSAVSRIETGKRATTVEELLALAAALEVSPVSLLFPGPANERAVIAPSVVIPSGEARAWVRGEAALPGYDERFYEEQSPDFWGEISGLRRFTSLHVFLQQLANAADTDDTSAMRDALRGLATETSRKQRELSR